MKIALYIEDGLEQIVLTPETDTEAGIVGKLHDDRRLLQISKGSFFKCQGGWMRHAQPYITAYGDSGDDESTIIILEPETKPMSLESEKDLNDG